MSSRRCFAEWWPCRFFIIFLFVHYWKERFLETIYLNSQYISQSSVPMSQPYLAPTLPRYHFLLHDGNISYNNIYLVGDMQSSRPRGWQVPIPNTAGSYLPTWVRYAGNISSVQGPAYVFLPIVRYGFAGVIPPIKRNPWDLDFLLFFIILSLIAYTFRENREFVFIIIEQFMMSANIRIRFDL